MNSFQELFDRQKRLFATGTTRTYKWRIEQLDRMARLVGENETALQQTIYRDFKTASQDYIFETFASLGEVMYQKSQLKECMAPVVKYPSPKLLPRPDTKESSTATLMVSRLSLARSMGRFSCCFVQPSRPSQPAIVVC